jgi:hypothetical protein
MISNTMSLMQIAISCEFICFSLLNLFSFSKMQEIYPQLNAFVEINYILNNYFSAKIFAFAIPFVLGATIYITALFYYKKIDIYIFLVFLLPILYIFNYLRLSVIGEMTHYDENPYIFFYYYCIGIGIMLVIWIFMVGIQRLLEKILFGGKDYSIKNIFYK